MLMFCLAAAFLSFVLASTAMVAGRRLHTRLRRLEEAVRHEMIARERVYLAAGLLFDVLERRGPAADSRFERAFSVEGGTAGALPSAAGVADLFRHDCAGFALRLRPRFAMEPAAARRAPPLPPVCVEVSYAGSYGPHRRGGTLSVRQEGLPPARRGIFEVRWHFWLSSRGRVSFERAPLGVYRLVRPSAAQRRGDGEGGGARE